MNSGCSHSDLRSGGQQREWCRSRGNQTPPYSTQFEGPWTSTPTEVELWVGVLSSGTWLQNLDSCCFMWSKHSPIPGAIIGFSSYWYYSSVMCHECSEWSSSDRGVTSHTLVEVDEVSSPVSILHCFLTSELIAFNHSVSSWWLIWGRLTGPKGVTFLPRFNLHFPSLILLFSIFILLNCEEQTLHIYIYN